MSFRQFFICFWHIDFGIKIQMFEIQKESARLNFLPVNAENRSGVLRFMKDV